MRKEEKTFYELVEKDAKDTSIFHLSGGYEPDMLQFLLAWILEIAAGGILLKDLNSIIDEFAEVVKCSLNSSFNTYFFSSSPSGHITMDFDGVWHSKQLELEELCSKGFIEKAMPIFQITEKGKEKLIEWKQAIADFYVKTSSETIEEIVRNLLKGRKIFGYQQIKYHSIPEPRDRY